MTRAFSLVCFALLSLSTLLVATERHAFAGRQSIAVLGLEVVDPSGTPTAQDTQVAKELTDGLRSRAKAGTSQYQLAPGSDKELIDQKLLNNCDNEAPACMSAIGNQLGADVMMYGRIQKDANNKGYTVTIKLLDVGRKAMMKTVPDQIPASEAQGAALQGWAKKIYARLTGESTGGTLVVHLSNADRGTILLNGEEKGSITSSTGTVSGLSEGKYHLVIESDGFRRWEKDITVSNGGTANIQADLEAGAGGIGPGPGPGPGPGGPGDTTARGSGLWKGMFVGALLVTGGGVGLAVYGNGLRSDARNALCDGGAYHNVDSTCPDMVTNPLPDTGNNSVKYWNDKGDSGKLYGRIGAGVAIAAGGFAIVALYKGFIEKTGGSASSREHAERDRGHRVRRDRMVITPVIAPSGAGATLRLDW